MRWVTTLWALALSACAHPDPELVELSVGDDSALGEWVQPVLRQNCASLDCHGDADRPLRLFALHGLRIDATLRGKDETTEELSANALALAAIDPGARAEESLIILKPLGERAGGYEHVGGAIFEDMDDPGFVCLLSWLRDQLPGDAAGEGACRAARESD